MTYTPTKLTKWTRPQCYVGPDWPEYYGSLGRHRDSDCLDRSNFQVALARLGGESETVLVVRERHWAVGWIEWIAIHESDETALKIGDEIEEDLAQYPVLSDDDFSELEREEAQVVWKECYGNSERLAYIRNNRDQFEFQSYREMIECVRGRYFCGVDSELLN